MSESIIAKQNSVKGRKNASAPLRPALWRILRRGYSMGALQRDLGAGLTVGVVALPLAMAFAIAAGAPPERGLFTAIVAGFLISALGGSRYQIGGPTGAFVVIIASVLSAHGYPGLVAATLVAGVILALMGMLRMGRMLKYIPYPVTTGFTAGIGVLIAVSQFQDFLGLTLAAEAPSGFLQRIQACCLALPTLHLPTLLTAATAMALILFTRRFMPRIPAPIVGVLGATLLAQGLAYWGFVVPTIGSRFGGVPDSLPQSMSLAELQNVLQLVPTVLPEALTIALLAGIESLLSAVVADGMSGDKHDASMELIAQGIANTASALCGGIPATGAIARTATNIRSGAYSPLSGVIHAATLALFMVSMAPLAAGIPLASLAAVLMVVAWDMSEARSFKKLLTAPRSDVAVLLATFLLTLLVDLTVAVQVGVVLAALLFMRRMSELTRFRLHTGTNMAAARGNVFPDNNDVLIYEIDGPFFFGVASKFSSMLEFGGRKPRVLLLDMHNVPSIDATGIHALETMFDALAAQDVTVVVAGTSDGVLKVIARMGLDARIGKGRFIKDMEEAMAWAHTSSLADAGQYPA